MRLGHVHEVRVGDVAVAEVEALDVARPATKRRSGVAAEDEQHGATAEQRAQLDRGGAVGRVQAGVGGVIARPQPLRGAMAQERCEDDLAQSGIVERVDVGAILVGERGVGAGGRVAMIADRARRRDEEPRRRRMAVMSPRLLARSWLTVVPALILLALPAGGAAQATVTPQAFPSCGAYRNRNTPPTAAQRRVNACILAAARDGRRARAVAVYTTMEGDPIANYVFVRGRKNVLVVVDWSRDRFGGNRTWVRERCARLLVDGGFLGWSGCTQLGTGKPAWLTPTLLGRD
jgi:hypothetical protein